MRWPWASGTEDDLDRIRARVRHVDRLVIEIVATYRVGRSIHPQVAIGDRMSVKRRQCDDDVCGPIGISLAWPVVCIQRHGCLGGDVDTLGRL